MADKSKIQWTNGTVQVTDGCSKKSEGCRSCYAMRDIWRMSHNPVIKRELSDLIKMTSHGPEWTGVVRPYPGKLEQLLRWQKPRMVFINSLSDLFHADIPFDYIAAVFGVMASAGQHTCQVLTKRAARMLEFFEWLEAKAEQAAEVFPDDSLAWRRGHVLQAAARKYGVSHKALGVVEQWPLPNVMLGVSAEDQYHADRRIPLLLKCPAAVRWVSAEPLLGPINFDRWLEATVHCSSCDARYGLDQVLPDSGPDPHPHGADMCAECGSMNCMTSDWGYDLHHDGPPLGWVVVGGESGPGARVCEYGWLRHIVQQCQRAEVPVFVKQVGACYVDAINGVAGARLDVDETMCSVTKRLKHKKGGDLEEWPDVLKVRQWPGELQE